MPFARLRAIEYVLPDGSLSNSDLAAQFPEWSVDKIAEKTGIEERRIVAPAVCSSDLACAAAEKLFASGVVQRAEIDFILLCTQTPDYILPTTACLIQSRLQLPTRCGALDFNLGCSGFVYGLGLAKGLIQTGQARNVLLLTAETYSKLLKPDDKSVRTIFGDAAAATLAVADGEGDAALGPFLHGTDGTGAPNLIVKSGAFRLPVAEEEAQKYLYMNGAEIFNFTLTAVPEAVNGLLSQAGQTLENVDLFVLHQANRFMLEHIRKKLKIPPEKFFIFMKNCGNTVSSTIPIALHEAQKTGVLKSGMTVMLVGFGVGYSWSACLLKWA